MQYTECSKQESSAKLTNQRVSYAFTSSPLSFHPVIFCLLPSSSIAILVFYLFSTEISEQHDMCENSRPTVSVNTVHWFDASSSVTPMNNPITLISAVQSLGYIFLAADTLCVALQISEQYSPKARTPTHWMPSLYYWMPSSDQILTQNDQSRSFKVICFGVNEEPLRGYIVQYNKCGHECEGSEDIASERSENRLLRRPRTHLTPPLQQTPANVHINFTLLETRIPVLQFCRWRYIGSSSNLRTVMSESQKRQFISCRARNWF